MSTKKIIIMNLKKELFNTYVNRIADFQRIHESCPDSICGPLLISPNEKYALQPYPLLIIGQETNGWGICKSPVTQEGLMKLMVEYEEFCVGKDYYASPFWNVTRKIEQLLGNEPFSCAWTNISKYDLNCGRPDAEHEKILSPMDNLLVDEIRIMKPKICIFFTGYLLDYRIQNIFKNVEFLQVNGFTSSQLCQLKHDQLPLLTYRTYHPGYLRRGGLEEQFIEFINLIK